MSNVTGGYFDLKIWCDICDCNRVVRICITEEDRQRGFTEVPKLICHGCGMFLMSEHRVILSDSTEGL